ncbi:MAG: type II secretion system minor pseudopilin GspH [Gammaproteobacteria bacterium]
MIPAAARRRTGAANHGLPLHLVRPADLAHFTARSRGFTLLELLAVIVIIGIIITFAVLSVDTGSRAQAVEQEARRLAALIGMAAEEAVFQSQELGLRVTERGYIFLTFQDNTWHPLDTDQMLRPRELPADIGVELIVEQLPAKLGTADEEEDEQNKSRAQEPAPQILILSSGELTPFEIRLVTQDSGGYRLIGSITGKVEIEALQDHER